MAKTWTQFVDQVNGRVQDRAKNLQPEDIDNCLRQAIQQRYSKDVARKLVVDAASDGTAFLALPDAFEDGFSDVQEVEFPIGRVPRQLIDSHGWQLYQSPTGLQLAFDDQYFNAGDDVRLTLTVRHADTGATVPLCDFEAVCDYAAALAFEKLAAVYVQTADPSIAADTVNYRTKSQECLTMAKQLAKRYYDHVGVEDGSGSGSSTAAPAMATGDVDLRLAPGVDRMTHGGRR